jgi:hypothetical protein
LVISCHPHTHEYNQCISRAKTRFVDRLRELGKSIGIKEGPVLCLLPIKHRAFSACNIAGTLSGSEKLIALGVAHPIAIKIVLSHVLKKDKYKASQFLIWTKCEVVSEIESQQLNHEINYSAQENSFLHRWQKF